MVRRLIQGLCVFTFACLVATADECREAYAVAVHFQNNGHPDFAWEEWQNVIANCKDAERVRKAKLFAGACLFQLKKFKEAEDQLQPLLEKEWSKEATKLADMHLRRAVILILAACHLQLKNEDKAAKLLAEFEKEFPDNQDEAEAVRMGRLPPYGTAPDNTSQIAAPAPGR